MHDRAILIRDVVLLSDPAEVAATLGAIDDRLQIYQSAAAAMDRMFDENIAITPDERTSLADVKQSEAAAMPLIGQIVALRQARHIASSKVLEAAGDLARRTDDLNSAVSGFFSSVKQAARACLGLP